MPFYAYKDEDHQVDMLVPRPGWQCDIGPDAPVVYKDQTIVTRQEFDNERSALLGQVPALRRYADLILKHDPALFARVAKAAQTPSIGQVVTGFVTFLRYNPKLDLVDFAKRQQPVLETWAQRTSTDTKVSQFNRYYREAISDLHRYTIR